MACTAFGVFNDTSTTVRPAVIMADAFACASSQDEARTIPTTPVEYSASTVASAAILSYLSTSDAPPSTAAKVVAFGSPATSPRAPTDNAATAAPQRSLRTAS